MYMKSGVKNSDDDWLQKLRKVPRGIQGKALTKQKLDQYFDVVSIEELRYLLYQFTMHGYLRHEVLLSSEYAKLGEARKNALQDTGIVRPPNIFLAGEPALYNLMSISGTPMPYDVRLSEGQIHQLLSTLPSDLLERYVQFKLTDVNQKKFREVIAARPAISKRTPKMDNHYTAGIKELVISGSEVTYNHRLIPMNRRQKEFLRMFLEKPEATPLSPERFINNSEIFKPAKIYDYPYATLSKLISETHKILKQTVGVCIFRDANGNWYMQID
jgi:hypothetical protein